ncbi:hypothetical protein KDH_01640 [Dictyobacter sp. S3.2.2.5]|uniref:Secreted protein n=1 Tax=Dictyobacter halimunensis TaxID=3026934 RepID=A0ABQ6FJF0_9CHLR|nr:hypothetical protein KDH_01640 [Dictyobacter sp. S3.2.2.5]
MVWHLSGTRLNMLKGVFALVLPLIARPLWSFAQRVELLSTICAEEPQKRVKVKYVLFLSHAEIFFSSRC